ncbi:hypothetical protein ABZX77_15500 [Streptomyces sp. NPDC004237]|uniref:hypothetical protein n=1 Tax=Streptomyces sp. NPDC004237 TaxID=3154455 RepID=UPI0033AAFD53
MVQTLAAGDLQGDLQRELTDDNGLRATEAKGNRGGRRPAIAASKTDVVHTAYLEGRSIAALAPDHAVSCGAIRTAVADPLPQYKAADPGYPSPGAVGPPRHAGQGRRLPPCRSPGRCRARRAGPIRASRRE